MITVEQLRKVLDYDPLTGAFRWKVTIGNNVSRHYPGEIAGSVRKDNGYVNIAVHRKKYFAHRLAWLYVYEKWPLKIDHRDMNKQNNAIGNLREATTSQNDANRGAQKNNKLGLKGVRERIRGVNRYEARIAKDGVQVVVGYFPTAEQAHAAYLIAARQLYGEFARGK
jgi:hypothetical protein